eukprot:6202644-Pleurochrysis_carterae.AAC.1
MASQGIQPRNKNIYSYRIDGRQGGGAHAQASASKGLPSRSSLRGSVDCNSNHARTSRAQMST